MTSAAAEPDNDQKKYEVDKNVIEEAVKQANVHSGPFRVRESGPSNEVIARVGINVYKTASNGVHNGKSPDDIRKEIWEKHQVRLSLSELRLLLASRV